MTLACFNPRPPSLAGATGGGDLVQHPLVVSILARHRWRALHAAALAEGDPLLVSILARHRWRALLHVVAPNPQAEEP
jgi:hypothetical protein